MKTIVLFFFLFLFSVQLFGEKACTTSISSPSNGSVVQNNDKLKDKGLFSFTVKGKALLAENTELCIYVTTPGGKEWWRSGKPVKKSGDWEIQTVSCGKLDKPNPECTVAVTVHGSCPESGQRVKELPSSTCLISQITVKTK